MPGNGQHHETEEFAGDDLARERLCLKLDLIKNFFQCPHEGDGHHADIAIANEAHFLALAEPAPDEAQDLAIEQLQPPVEFIVQSHRFVEENAGQQGVAEEEAGDPVDVSQKLGGNFSGSVTGKAPDLRTNAIEEFCHQTVKNFTLAGEVKIKSAAGHVGPLDDVRDLRLVIPAGSKGLQGGFEKLAAAVFF